MCACAYLNIKTCNIFRRLKYNQYNVIDRITFDKVSACHCHQIITVNIHRTQPIYNNKHDYINIIMIFTLLTIIRQQQQRHGIFSVQECEFMEVQVIFVYNLLM